MKFDLHLHSWFSDGKSSPSELIRKAKKGGLEIVSLTDHESVEGISEALIEAQRVNVRVIPGIEIPAFFGTQEIHLLGYFISFNDSILKLFLKKWRETKYEQVEKIIQKLAQYGLKITLEEVLLKSRDALERPHISQGVWEKEENRKILEKNWQINSERAFFRKFLLEEGLAYFPRQLPSFLEVLNLLQRLKGKVFLAHPVWKEKNLSSLKKKILGLGKLGLDGIEIGHPFHHQSQVFFLHKLAQNLGLFESAGSDFHGIEGSKKRRIGDFPLFGIKINFPFEGE
jgi:hypothetical protein